MSTEIKCDNCGKEWGGYGSLVLRRCGPVLVSDTDSWDLCSTKCLREVAAMMRDVLPKEDG